MLYNEILPIAEEVKSLLEPHCIRIEIAGSIRRKKPECKDVEIVCIPKPFEAEGFFKDGIATVIDQWEKVKGDLAKGCKYTERIFKGVKIDVFFAVPENWGYIMAIRTGSADYSHRILAKAWVKKGYVGKDGFLTSNGKIVPVREESELFRLLNLPMLPPEKRYCTEQAQNLSIPVPLAYTG